MSAKRDGATVVGLGVAACAVCCAGPILGALAAIGLGTAVGVVVFGLTPLLLGAAAIAFLVVRRRRQRTMCSPTQAAGMPVHLALTRRR